MRRVGLPRPGRIRELLEHVADFHAVRLNRDRPLWEAHLVEGLEDGRFALCTKMHHSQFDGVNILLGGFSPDPADRIGTAPWITTRTPPRRAGTGARPGTGSEIKVDSLTALGRKIGDIASQIGGVAPRIGGTVQASPATGSCRPRRRAHAALHRAEHHAQHHGQLRPPLRRDAWPIDRLRKVAHHTDTSINDVALTMCAGVLRAYLIDHNALPTESLVATVPVSLTPTDRRAAAREGNSWAAVLCNLGTDCDDNLTRLRRIHASMRRSKNLMPALDPVTATAISASTLGGVALNSIPGLPLPPRPPFNLVISNVPSVTKKLYLNGCELTDAYPVSVVTDGQALNMTLVSYPDQLAFDITGCRRSVPHLQQLLPHLEPPRVRWRLVS